MTSPQQPDPDKWLSTLKIATRMLDFIKWWCEARKYPDGTPIPEPDCYAIDLSEPAILQGVLGAIEAGYISTGYERTHKWARLFEIIHIALESGEWLNGEPVTLESVRLAAKWAWNDSNLDTIDEEAKPKIIVPDVHPPAITKGEA